MGKSMDSLPASYRLALTEPASGGCWCSPQGQDSAIGAPCNGEMAAVDISLLSSPVSTVRQNAVNLSRVHSAVADTPDADLTACHPFPLH
mgnify:FL=1